MLRKDTVCSFMPELFGYLLTGKKYNEYTMASTGELLNAKARDWDFDLIKKAGLRTDIFGELVQLATVIGDLLPEVTEDTRLSGAKVIAVGSHDTASAVAGSPPSDKDAVFLSCGTWSLMGMELDDPILTDESFKYNYTNEGGVEGNIRYLKNINGLWIMQNLRKTGANLRKRFPSRISSKLPERQREKILPLIRTIRDLPLLTI
ncbi:MAG: FGGY family carbohydrate kinase [Lachnospiraceae bacterium]